MSATARAWLAQVYADREASDDIRKVAAAIAECPSPDEEYFRRIGGSNVFADEFLFQLADDVTDLRAVSAAIRWLGEHGYLTIFGTTCNKTGSVLLCGLVVEAAP